MAKIKWNDSEMRRLERDLERKAISDWNTTISTVNRDNSNLSNKDKAVLAKNILIRKGYFDVSVTTLEKMFSEGSLLSELMDSSLESPYNKDA